MADFETYQSNSELLLIDIVNDPAFSEYITPEEVFTSTINVGDGSLQQIQMLDPNAATAVAQRILKSWQSANRKLKDKICGPAPDGFDWCKRRNDPDAVGKLYRFLKSPTGGGLTTIILGGLDFGIIGGLLALTPHALDQFCGCS